VTDRDAHQRRILALQQELQVEVARLREERLARFVRDNPLNSPVLEAALKAAMKAVFAEEPVLQASFTSDMSLDVSLAPEPATPPLAAAPVETFIAVDETVGAGLGAGLGPPLGHPCRPSNTDHYAKLFEGFEIDFVLREDETPTDQEEGFVSQEEVCASEAIEFSAASAQTQLPLTDIAAIGPGLIRRLEALGIQDLAGLALCNPDILRRDLGPIGRLIHIEDWIRQAQERTGLKNQVNQKPASTFMQAGLSSAR
jgi:predicted flap endonuclease-1-like 5' DNA nuclease